MPRGGARAYAGALGAAGLVSLSFLVLGAPARADDSPPACDATARFCPSTPLDPAGATSAPTAPSTPDTATTTRVGVRAATAATPTRSVLIPTFTIAVTDSLGNTVAAVGGTAVSRTLAATTLAPTTSPAVASTGSRTTNELGIAAALLLAGSGLVVLGSRHPRRTH